MSSKSLDEARVLREKRATLQAELDGLRATTRGTDDLNQRRQRLEGDLIETLRMLEACAPTGPSRLDNLRIASPCTVRWEDMLGGDRARFCVSCERDVYDVSAMTRAEANEFLADRGVSECVRMFRRTDGTILTADCPIGLKKKRFHLAVFSVTGAVLMAAGAALALREGEQTCTKVYVVREHALPETTATAPTNGHHIAGGVAPRPESFTKVPEQAPQRLP